MPYTSQRKNPFQFIAAKINICICLLLIALTLSVYSKTYNFDVALAEETMIVKNFHNGITHQNLKKIITLTPHIQPFSIFLCLINAEFFGNKIGPRHLVNVFLHICSTILIFLFLSKATKKPWPSGFVAALFAVHPINVESVAWIAYHDSSLNLFFISAGMLSYLYYVRAPSIGKYVLISGFFIFAMLSHPRVATFPLLLVIIDYWPLCRTGKNKKTPYSISYRKNYHSILKHLYLKEKIPLLCIVFLLVGGGFTYYYYYYSAYHISQFSPRLQLSTIFYLPNALVSYLGYLYKIFYPIDLVPARCLPRFSASLWQIFISLTVLVGITAIVIYVAVKSEKKYLAAGWLWFLIATMPGVFVNAARHVLITDRYVYLGSLGIFVATAWGLYDLSSKWKYGKMILSIIGISIIMVLLFCTNIQISYWEKREKLYHHAINILPSQEAYLHLGESLLSSGKIQNSIKSYQEALKTEPDSIVILNSIGVAYLKNGDTHQAMAAFSKALTMISNYVSTKYNLNINSLENQIDDKGFTKVERKIYASILHNMGNTLIDSGNIEKAIPYLQKSLKINPYLFQAHNSLATALIGRGEYKKAIYHLETALELNPGYETAKYNLKKIECDGRFHH